MKGIFFWIIAAFILICFGVTGRIDYESELAMAEFRKEYAKSFHNRRAAAMAAQEAK